RIAERCFHHPFRLTRHGDPSVFRIDLSTDRCRRRDPPGDSTVVRRLEGTYRGCRNWTGRCLLTYPSIRYGFRFRYPVYFRHPVYRCDGCPKCRFAAVRMRQTRPATSPRTWSTYSILT